MDNKAQKRSRVREWFNNAVIFSIPVGIAVGISLTYLLYIWLLYGDLRCALTKCVVMIPGGGG